MEYYLQLINTSEDRKERLDVTCILKPVVASSTVQSTYLRNFDIGYTNSYPI
jgi:hypothetical protein